MSSLGQRYTDQADIGANIDECSAFGAMSSKIAYLRIEFLVRKKYLLIVSFMQAVPSIRETNNTAIIMALIPSLAEFLVSMLRQTNSIMNLTPATTVMVVAGAPYFAARSS
jgi:hypothetical protein